MPFAALLIPFVAWLAIFALPALSQTSTATHGSTGIKGFIDSIIHSKPLSDLFGLANKAVRFVVSKFAGAQLTHATAYLNTMTSLWKQTYRAQQAEAEATSSFAAAVEQAIPREARKAAHPALVRSRTALKHADHANAHAGAVGHALNAFKSRVNPRIAHATHAVDVTLPRDIARVRSREEALSRDQARLRERTNALEDGALDLWKWIRTHPLSATTGVFAGAVAIALGRLGLGGLRCRNFTNLLKREGCGFGTLLGRLLPLAALLTVGFDFEDFVRASEFVAEGIGEAVAGIEGVYDLSLPPLPPPHSD